MLLQAPIGQLMVEAAMTSGLVQGHVPCQPSRGWEEGLSGEVGGHELTKNTLEQETTCSLEGGQAQEPENLGYISCWEGLDKAGDGGFGSLGRDWSRV